MLTSTYYPGTTDCAAAKPVSVAAGRTTGGIELPLQSGPSFHVSGIVVDTRGRPVEGAWIRLMADAVAAGNSPGEVQSDANGRFRLDGVHAGQDPARSRYRRRSADFLVAAPAQPRTITVYKEDVSDIRMVVRLSTD